MDYHNPIDLEGVPSDAFDSEDLDFDQFQAGSDYSSWPAESSPGPAEAHEDEGMEYPDPEIDDAYGHQEGEEIYEDEEEEEDEDEDQDVDDEHSEHEAEDEDENAFEYVLDDDEELEAAGFAGQGEGGWDSEADLEEGMSDHQPSPAPHFVDLLADYRAHQDDDDDDALFVDQGAFLPPLEDLLSSVRRNHERALDLVSELHSEVRNLGQERPSFGRGSAGPSRENHRQNHRHHPYGMPQDFGRERARMGDYRNSGRLRDELVEGEMQPPRAGMRRNRPSPRAEPEVIDLTGEPDSPEMPRAIVPPRARAPNAPQAQIPGRNPRRQMSLNQRTPSLSRSDGSLLGNQTNVIDLTLDDSPAPPPLPQQLPRRNNPDNSPHHRQNRHHRRRHSARIQPIDVDRHEGFGAAFAGLFRSRLGLIQRLGFGRAHDVEVQFIGGRGLNMDNPLAGNIPNLDYRVNGNNAGGPPKPDHVPPPPAREGFTRDTGNAEDVVICPSCSQELKYDPDGPNDDAMPPRPVKKPRTRKDQAEHYFWALKDCGHVYCKDCYENRKVGAKSPMAHFRRDPENNRKNLCAVEGCPTEANNKLAWVGLFL